MGVGCGFAIAAALLEQEKVAKDRVPVVSIQGDSAFGFSGMEFETAFRYVSMCGREYSHYHQCVC